MGMSKTDIIHNTLSDMIDNHVNNTDVRDQMSEMLGELYDIAESKHSILKLKVSVMDTEPVGELVNIIVLNKQELPEKIQNKIQEWVDKYLQD